jgi:mannose-6-phosphate isomerase-like protein (cupin superfamily)
MRKLRDFLARSIYERAVRKTVLTNKFVSAAACSVCGVLSIAASPWSQAKASEQGQAAQAIEKALQKHGADVHRCFEKVLADRLDAAGKVEVVVDVGKGGKVTSAKVKKTDAPPALAACVEKAARGWIIEGIEPGAAVVLPFSFKPQTSQYVVSGADIPERSLGAPSKRKARSGPTRAAPFTVKVLVDQTNLKAQGISLTQLNIGPASRVAMHRHPHSAKILYLVKGHARLLGPEGTPPMKFEEGMAVFIPAGYPHVIENMGRQSTGVLLQAFSPPGPERVYRDPRDARGRADFEVIRDPSQAKLPPESEGKLLVATAEEAKPEPLPNGAGSARTLLQGTGAHPMSLAVLELSDGAELQGRGDLATNQVLYFLSGGGSVRVAGETMPLAPESVVYLPRGTAYAIKAATVEKGEKILVVQFRVPAAGKAGKVRSAAPAAPRK